MRMNINVSVIINLPLTGKCVFDAI